MIFWRLGAELLVLHGKSFERPCLFKIYSERCCRPSENLQVHIDVLEAGEDLSAGPFVKSELEDKMIIGNICTIIQQQLQFTTSN